MSLIPRELLRIVLPFLRRTTPKSKCCDAASPEDRHEDPVLPPNDYDNDPLLEPGRRTGG